MATYPGSVRVFTPKVNVVDLIDSSHPNTLQDEVAAVQATLGVMPHLSTNANPAGTFTATSTQYATLAARLANIETGVVAESHTQYQLLTGGRVMQGGADATVVHRVRARPTQTGALARYESSDAATAYLEVTTGGVTASALTVAGSPALTTSRLVQGSGIGLVVAGNNVTVSNAGVLSLAVTASSILTTTTTAGAASIVAPLWATVTPAANSGAGAVGTTATGVARGDHAHPAASTTKTIRVPHTFSVPGELLAPNGTDNVIPGFFVSLPSGQTASLTMAKHKADVAGSSVTLSRNGSAVTGFTTIAVGTTLVTADPANVALADNDYIQLAVTTAGGGKNLSFTVFIDYSV